MVWKNVPTFRLSCGILYLETVQRVRLGDPPCGRGGSVHPRKEPLMARLFDECIRYACAARSSDALVAGLYNFPELHADLFSRHASPLEVYVLWRSTKEVKMLSPTRFVADATENGEEGGVAAEVCSSHSGLLKLIEQEGDICREMCERTALGLRGKSLAIN